MTQAQMRRKRRRRISKFRKLMKQLTEWVMTAIALIPIVSIFVGIFLVFAGASNLEGNDLFGTSYPSFAFIFVGFALINWVIAAYIWFDHKFPNLKYEIIEDEE